MKPLFSSTRARNWMIGAAAIALLVGVGIAAWQSGLRSGMRLSAAADPESVAGDVPSAPGGAGGDGALPDPSTWTIPQGEEATRRHIREGLKAGDLDPATGRQILNYHDPMVPGRNFDAPAKSPFMDMMLVPRYAGADGADTGTVSVSPRIQQNLGLRTAPVVAGALAAEVMAVGNIAWNERDQTTVTSRATGFVEKLHVRATFDRVAAGAPLLDVYVPDWVAAQEDYLAVARMQGSGLDSLRGATLQRMRQAGMSPVQIELVQRTGVLQARFTLRAPQAGVVSALMVREGATVAPGTPLMTVQGTATVWAEAEVPESQSAELVPGMAVSATSPAVPGQIFEGRLQALLPQVDTITRTLKARLELPNPGGRLVPGMFVQMRFERPAADMRLLVPSDAVIRTGQRSVVMLAEADGRFRPVEVQTGREAGDQVEVTAGLQAGQRVVRSGQFLIDSEASLRGLEARLNQGAEPTVPAPPVPQSHRTDAVINALEGDTVTLTHPPVPSLNWPEMTMDFKLPTRERQPRDLGVGEKVQIEFQMQDGEVPQITDIQRVAPGGPR
jgi:Cu(I)/Ag(I) efflux system membrane fusion protein